MNGFVVTQHTYLTHKASAMDNLQRYKATKWPVHWNLAKQHGDLAIVAYAQLQEMYRRAK